MTKIPLTYSVSYFNLGGLGALFGGAKPTKDPRGDGTGIATLTGCVSDMRAYKNILIKPRGATVNGRNCSRAIKKAQVV